MTPALCGFQGATKLADQRKTAGQRCRQVLLVRQQLNSLPPKAQVASRDPEFRTADEHTAGRVLRAGLALTEKPAGGTGVAVPVIGDVPAMGIGPPSLVPVVAVGHLGHPSQQALLGLCVRKAVRAPDDHRRRADHALGYPALLVLVEPGRELMGEAKLAIGVVGGKLLLFGQELSPRTSVKTSSA